MEVNRKGMGKLLGSTLERGTLIRWQEPVGYQNRAA
jgi:hypothetical protein